MASRTIHQEHLVKQNLFQGIDSLKQVEAGLSQLNEMFTISLGSVRSFVKKNCIKPMRIDNTYGNNKGIYSAETIIKMAVENGHSITKPKSELNIQEHNLENHIDEINQYKRELELLKLEIQAAQKKLNFINAKIDYAKEESTLTKDEILMLAGIVPKIIGIYFLIDKNEVVYVGQSKDIYTRINTHRKHKVFDTFTYIRCPKDMLNIVETRYIKRLEPKLNRNKDGRLVYPGSNISDMMMELTN